MRRALHRTSGLAAALGWAVALVATPVAAHGPLFSAGPEVIYKGGIEFTTGYARERTSGTGEDELEQETFLEAEYGLTPWWEAAVEVPYAWKEEDGRDAEGVGDIALETKYQFWRRDLPHAQQGASVLFKTELPTGDDDSKPRIGSGSVDFTGGLAGGHEGRRWYGFADAVYRLNTEGEGGLEEGDTLFLDVVGGVRPVLSGYKDPDTVLMVELNWERSWRDELNGSELADTGGWELFVSPVIWWTYRQAAVRGGVQIPIAEDLNGDQPSSDYRALVEFVYHF